MSSPVFGEAYVENLRREPTRAQARLKRAENERDRALVENARLRRLLGMDAASSESETG